MKEPSDGPPRDWQKLRRRVLGLGERSHRKSYYPELQRKHSELERFRSLLDQSHDGILLISRPDGEITDANERAAEIFSLEHSDLIGSCVCELLGPQVLGELRNVFTDCKVSPSSPVVLTSKLQREQQEEVIIEINVVVRTYQDKSFALATVRDVTEQSHLENQLRQSQKLQAIGQLAGGVAHDFNNLLSGILGYAELIQLETQDAPALKDMTKAIITAANRAASLTGKLLAFARCGVTESVEVDVNNVAQEVLDLLLHTVDRRIKLTFQPCSEAVIILGDGALLQNALLNLSINARDAMPEGGELKIKVHTEKCDVNFIQKEGLDFLPGKMVVITVKDNGCGISKNHLDHIFEPFFTTKDIGEGTGLGLAAVYGTAAELGGGITVYSELGVGTTFTLYLPAVSHLSEKTELPKVTIPTGREHILVVDDELAVRDVTSRILRGLEYEADHVANGLEAIAAISSKPDKYALILLDVIMPGPPCMEIVQKIKELNKNIRIIIITGHDFGASRDALLAAGAETFLTKPFDRRELAETVRLILDRTQS